LSSTGVGDTALTEAQIPAHSHGLGSRKIEYTGSPGSNSDRGDGANATTRQQFGTDATGGGAVHTHDLSLAYINVIVCSKA